MFYLEREHGRVQVGRGAEGEREERGRNLKQTPVSGEPDTGLSTPHYFMCLDSIHYPLLGYILCSFSMFIIDFSPLSPLQCKFHREKNSVCSAH